MRHHLGEGGRIVQTISTRPCARIGCGCAAVRLRSGRTARHIYWIWNPFQQTINENLNTRVPYIPKILGATRCNCSIPCWICIIAYNGLQQTVTNITIIGEYKRSLSRDLNRLRISDNGLHFRTLHLLNHCG